MWRRGVRSVAAAAVLALCTAGCATVIQSSGQYSQSRRPVPDAKVQINGLPASGPTEADRVAGNAIADIQQFWTEKFPQAFDGKQYQGPQGGFFSVDPGDPSESVPCVSNASEIRGNAFYCPPRDIVAYDRVNLLPQLQEKFGPLLVAM